MKFGIGLFATENTPPPGELGRLVEDYGFESLFLPEHTHIPASRETPYPAGGELPPEYSHTYDPFLALTAAAAATTELRIGTGICLVIERDPIITAKEVATLDHLSGGRFLFGVGAGWNVEEMRNHGTDARTRFGLLRERVQAMKEIWTQDEASYAGRQVSFERIWSWPKPLQRPHPPILIGGNGPTVLERVIELGDEWLPNRIGDDDGMIARFEELARRAQQTDREPVPITVAGLMRDPARIERFERAGVHRGFFWIRSVGRAEIEPVLEKYATAVNQYARAGA